MLGDSSMNNFSRIGKIIYSLRNKAGLKQTELAQQLSEMQNRKKPMTAMTISNWETGRSSPNNANLKTLADIFHVDPNYILCITDNINGFLQNSQSNNPKNILDSIDNSQLVEIDMCDISMFHGRPVYVTFKNYTHPSQWALVNKERSSLILTEGIMPLSNKSIDKIYVNNIYFSSITNEIPMDMAKLINSKHPVWCEMISSDAYIKGLYNGWFHHNETHTCLINERGLTLPYEGIDISYIAFQKNRVKL